MSVLSLWSDLGRYRVTLMNGQRVEVMAGSAGAAEALVRAYHAPWGILVVEPWPAAEVPATGRP